MTKSSEMQPPSASPNVSADISRLSKDTAVDHPAQDGDIHGSSVVDTADPEKAVPAVTGGDDETEFLHGIPLLLVMTSVTMASFLVLIDTSIVATALPKITTEFHSLPDIGWYGSAFQITSAALQPLVGKIYTQFSLKWVFLAFFLLFEIGSLICGAAQSSVMLIIGRAVAGMGLAGVFSGGLTIIGTSLAPAKRAFYIGICMGFSQLGIVIGPLLGGALTEKVSWRWCFYINLPLGAVVAGGILFVNIRNQGVLLPVRQVIPKLHKTLDLIGFCLLAPTAVMLLLALEWGGDKYAWDSATIIGLFCGTGATFLVFSAWTWYKGEEGLIPTNIIKNRIVVASCVVGVGVMVASFIISYWLPVYFQTVKGVSPLTSGVNLLPNIMPGLFMSVLVGFSISKIGYYLPFAVAGGAVIAVAAGLLTMLQVDTPTAKWAGFLVVLGIGRGLCQQISITAVQHAITGKLLPVAMSTVIFCQYLGGSIFVSISNVIFRSSLETGIKKHAPDVSAELVVEAGASAVRNIGLTPKQLAGVLEAYTKGITDVFYLPMVVGICLLLAGFFTGWVDTRKPAASKKVDGDGENTAQ